MMDIKLYQINQNRDEKRRALLSTEALARRGFDPKVIDSSIYDCVFEGTVNCSDLEEVYTLFNVDPPEDFQGHSMSVSDVVVEGRTAFFCDSIGFRQVTFDESTARPLRREIHVVLLEPGKLARPASIDASLESYQKIVGGMIEAFYPFEEPVCIVCNEEGKLDGLTTIIESDDGHGNILEETVTETKTTLHIVVSHKTATEMAAEYGFGERQLEHLDALLEEGTSGMWAAVLYGVYGADDQIVQVALTQVGNVGGEPYWSWYGFGSRVEWCACFVSWCADQCGYIDTGVIPKFAGCVNGVQWFRDRGQWADNAIEPAPGMIIFFDWDNKGHSGPQDGQSDHVGIVWKVEDGIIYTVEGNSGDSCRVNQYPVGYYEILGYGVVAY